jgi:hypothetical protein
MAYIGIQPAESFTSFATQTFSVSATTSYTLDSAVANENEIALFVNNVRQQPGSGKAYTATGTALTLSAATATTDTMYCIYLGRALQTVVPATNSITAAMIGDTAISGKDALTSAPADTDELLISDAGTLKRIDYSLLKTSNTPAFHAYNNADQNISASTLTQVIFNTEIYDTASAFASNQFTVPSGQGGKYFVYFRLGFASGTDLSFQVTVQIDSAFNADSGFRVNQMNDYYDNAFSGQVLDLAAGEVVRVMIYQGDSTVNISGTENRANFGAFKLIT